MKQSLKRSGPWRWVLLVLAVVGGVWAIRVVRRGTAERPPLNTVRVERGGIEQTVTATGRLQPVRNVEVGSQVSGILSEILVDFNSEVAAGQVLARLDTATFEADVMEAQGEVDSAAAALDLARIEAERMEQLMARELIPQSELDQARARLRQAEAALKIRSHRLERVQSELARCTIYSPIDGLVISRNVDEGQTVAASMTAPVLFTLAHDLSRMHIHSHVPEADIGNIRAGQRVEFTVDAFPVTFAGSVVQVRNEPTISQHVVMYATIIAVDNPERMLKPGMTATVTIVTDAKDDVLRVRNPALRARLPEAWLPEPPESPAGAAPEGVWRTAYRLADHDPAGVLQAVSVRIGMSDGAWTEILAGLSEGDLLVTGVNLEVQAERRRGSLFGPTPAQY